MITLYGISNCDTVRKTKKWLEHRDIDYRYHDFRNDGVTADLIEKWCQALGWEQVLNKRGTTFRNLAETDKKDLSLRKAIKLMQQQPTLIKRPVIVADKHVHVGFSESFLQAHCL